jgi:hypothetical protein
MNNFDQLKKIDINGETILPITLYGPNRAPEVTEWNKRVMVDYLGLPMNYLPAPFPQISHGDCMNYVLKNTIDSNFRPDYYLFMDNDAVFMRKDALKIVYSIVSNKITLFGHVWNSAHKLKRNGTNLHSYCSQATICFASSLYDEMGRPDFGHNSSRSDTAEEMTWAIEEKGYILSLIYPSYSFEADCPFGNGFFYGTDNVYGPNLMYHCSRADKPRHVELFVERCKKIVNGEYEKKSL